MMIRFYKIAFFLFTCLTSSLWIVPEGSSQSLGIATNPINPYDLKVDVKRAGDAFLIHVSFIVPINACEAIAFLTNYEDAKNIPGIVESKIISRDGNKVRVERHVQERIILIPITMKSIVEYTELSQSQLNFEQLVGDTRSYKGSWQIMSEGDGTKLRYESRVELLPFIPRIVIEYFIKNSIDERFEVIAKRAAAMKKTSVAGCS
jgi:hypothetical protein